MSETVLIYATRRQRNHLIRRGVDIVAEYDEFVLARVTGALRAELAKTGYEVETYRAAPAAGAPPEAHSVADDAVAHSAHPTQFGPGAHYYEVTFIGPIKAEWLRDIEAHGGRLEEPHPPVGYVISLDEAAYDWLVTKTSFVQTIEHYGADKRLSPGLIADMHDDPFLSRGAVRDTGTAGAAPPSSERVPMAFVVRFFQPDDLAQAIKEMERIGATPAEPQSEGKMLTISFPPGVTDVTARLQQIARLHGVRSVEPYVLRQLRNDIAAGLMGAQEVQSPSGLGLSGRGEVVGVADSGLDTGDLETLHPDFAGRIAAILSWPVAADWATVVVNVGGDDGPADLRSGHGTHVAGSIAGNGAAALAAQGVAVRGLAYEATLFFQAVEQHLEWTPAYRQSYVQRYGRLPPEYGLAGLPTDLKRLFQQAYDYGVRLHNNSWGGGMFGAYDHYAEAVDRFTWEHKDFLPMFAAGNDGVDANRDGRVDEGSVTPPGTAKNCITVGAAESMRLAGGYQEPYGSFLPGSFPVAPLHDDRPSDNPDDIAAFSSRGPVLDGRIKPDVVAPGVNILSTRSSQLQGVPGWGEWSGSDRYMFNGGTSMASPLVTGATALVRQYLRVVKRRANPSAALIKATLIHGAQLRPYRYGVPNAGLYDYAQGWGHVTLDPVLAPPAPISVRWYDQRRGLNTGEGWRWSCSVRDSSVPLALTLVWTDYPGAANAYPNLVNDLDLVVTAPSGEILYGNAFAPGGTPDRINNVERVIVVAPEPGRYHIQVRAINVPLGPQDFALVYSGGLA